MQTSRLILGRISRGNRELRVARQPRSHRVVVAILGVLVLSSCAGAIVGVGAAYIGSQALPLGDAKVSSFDFGKGEITFYQQGCTHRGTWTNHSDMIQRNVRVDLQALDESGSTIGVSQLTFNATLPGETSYSKEQNIAWKQIDSAFYHLCPGITGVFAEAYLFN